MSKNNIISIGVTGKIGSGKTTVAKYFESTGYPVLFMDVVGHDVLKNKSVKDILVKRFGESLLTEYGEINRNRLGSIVFSDEGALQFLNSTMHPVMNDVAKEWILEQERKGERICFVEAAILFEMKMDEFLEKILFVDLAEKLILERTIKRSPKTSEEIQKILSTQYVKEDKIDYVIDNSGTLEELNEKCREFEYDILTSLKN